MVPVPGGEAGINLIGTAVAFGVLAPALGAPMPIRRILTGNFNKSLTKKVFKNHHESYDSRTD